MWNIITGVLLVSFTFSTLFSVKATHFISDEKASLDDWFCSPPCIPILLFIYFIPYLKWVAFTFIILIIIVALSKRKEECSIDSPYFYTFKPVDVWAILAKKLYTFIKSCV